jgi:pilus assembly protein CpaC
MSRFLKSLALAFRLAAGPYAVLALGSASAFAQNAGKHEELNLSVGETKTINAPGIDKFSNPFPEVATATPNDSNFVISGKKQGSTTLLLIRKDGSQTTYDINVSIRPIAIVEKELLALLSDYPGVKVRRVGPKFFIEGGVSTDADVQRINQIAAVYGEQVVSFVGKGRGADLKTLIRLDFFFVQYEKSSSYAVGIGWPATIGGPGILESTFSFEFLGRTTTAAQASLVNQPLPKLDIGARNGWAKVMKQATVITGNGAEAKFSSGGEQNFTQNTGLSVGLVQVRYGIDMSVLPRYDSTSKDVELKLTSDVSDLVPAVGGTVPGRTTTKLDTLVTLKLGQALVLSGIKTQTRRQDSEGLPLLSEIPVLGVLFGSQRKSEADTEGAIFIIPSVIESMPKSSLEVIKNAVLTYKEFSGDMRDLDTYPTQPPSAK